MFVLITNPSNKNRVQNFKTWVFSFKTFARFSFSEVWKPTFFQTIRLWPRLWSRWGGPFILSPGDAAGGPSMQHRNKRLRVCLSFSFRSRKWFFSTNHFTGLSYESSQVKSSDSAESGALQDKNERFTDEAVCLISADFSGIRKLLLPPGLTSRPRERSLQTPAQLPGLWAEPRRWTLWQTSWSVPGTSPTQDSSHPGSSGTASELLHNRSVGLSTPGPDKSTGTELESRQNQNQQSQREVKLVVWGHSDQKALCWMRRCHPLKPPHVLLKLWNKQLLFYNPAK